MKVQRKKKITKFVLSSIASLAMALLLFGCSGSDGTSGAPGVSTGTVTGLVTSDGTHALSGVVVSNNLNGTTATTGADGIYTLTLPIGSYTLSFKSTPAANYTAGTAAVSVASGTTTTSNCTLAATASGKPTVTVTADAAEIGYGHTTAVHAVATAPSGGTITYIWTGVAAASTTKDATVKTKDIAAAFAGVAAPAADPGGFVAAYTQENRFGILPINPDRQGGVTATVKADDGLGQSTSASVTVVAAGITTGLKNVPIGIPVLLNSGHDTANTWTVVAAPAGSTVTTATLNDAGTRNASFTPDKAGTYTVKEGSNQMDILAGNWVGAIGGGTEDANGVPAVIGNVLCTVCHFGPGVIAPDNFTPWAQTPHATFWATGLNGLTSNGSTCQSCHTTGYDLAPLAVNNGFDDLAKQYGWTYPTTKQKGNWKALWADTAVGAKVAVMSNIQCENCHGPNSTTGHKTTNVAGVVTQDVRTSMSAEVCSSCHASGTGHHNYSEWLAIDPDTGYGHSHADKGNSSFSGSASCARCHTAQGFLVYLTQIKAGNIGSLAGTLSNIVTAANSQPVTCTACHDPHDGSVSGYTKGPNGEPKSTQLRVFGSTPLLPSGFSVSGMGAGALCITCHNSRNGAQLAPNNTTKTYLHEDGQPASDGTNNYNGGNPTSFSAPHQACQADVFVGRNAYFMGTTNGISNLPMMSKHANVEEACVGCHMTNNPTTHLSHGAATTSKHTFFIRDQDKGKVCAVCHGNTNGEALVASTEVGLAAIKAKMEASLKAKLATATAAAPFYLTVYPTDGKGVILADTKGNEVATAKAALLFDNTNPVVSVVAEEVHGQNGFLVTLTNNVTMTITTGTGANAVTANYTFKQFEVQLGAIYNKNAGFAASPADADTVYKLNGNLVRAGWNFYLVEGDQSKGIHNPSFVNQVIANTLKQDLSN